MQCSENPVKIPDILRRTTFKKLAVKVPCEQLSFQVFGADRRSVYPRIGRIFITAQFLKSPNQLRNAALRQSSHKFAVFLNSRNLFRHPRQQYDATRDISISTRLCAILERVSLRVSDC